MNPPPLAPASEDTRVAVHLGPPGSLRLFEALDDGVVAGRHVRRGDLLACRHDLRAQGAAVLMPRGRGRPIPGAVRGDALLGPYNEPCHPDRWECAGPVVGWIRRLGRVWRVVEAFGPQLMLFEAA